MVAPLAGGPSAGTLETSRVERLLAAGATPKMILAATPPKARAHLRYVWRAWARPKQLEPPGDWLIWLLNAGRGWGKTRCGAEWVRERQAQGARLIALAGRTYAEACDLMITGPSGLLRRSPPWNRPVWRKQERRLIWPNGAEAKLFTGEDPEQGRGYEPDTLWADEIASWQYRQVWDNLRLALRGMALTPRACVTSTPKPHAFYRELLADPQCVVVRATSYENARNLPESYVTGTLDPLAQTRMGRQEIFAELLDDTPGALWTRATLEKTRVKTAPAGLVRVAIPVDPAVTYGERSDATGIVPCGLSADGHVYILGDASLKAPPAKWGRRVVDSYRLLRADVVVGEQNNGGDLVRDNILAVDPTVNYQKVWASRGKRTRAEPVSTWWELGRVHLVGYQGDLETELTTWVPDKGGESPNRLDAAVWGVTYLLGGAMLAGTAPAPVPLPAPDLLGMLGPLRDVE